MSPVFYIEVTVSIGLRLVTEWEYPLNYTNLDVNYSRQSAQTLLLFSFQLKKKAFSSLDKNIVVSIGLF